MCGIRMMLRWCDRDGPFFMNWKGNEMEKWRKRLQLALEKAGKKGLTFKELAGKCKVKKEESKEFRAAVEQCRREGIVLEKKKRLIAAGSKGLRPAVIKRLNRTYAFAELAPEGGEVFVLGSRLKGAMAGDRVLLRLSSGRGGLPEGEVRTILEENTQPFSGILRVLPEGNFIRPDELGNIDLWVSGDTAGAADGDKVLAEIIRRGESHRDHQARILKSFGPANLAAGCCGAILEARGISAEFPAAVLDEARNLAHRGLSDREMDGRADFRSERIFTIDGADSKDLDDAVSLHRYDGFYELGVHIADVSHYVRQGSLLDGEAFARGTSIYYADKVVPMLPKELSNGICSLNPGEDRLAFSAVLTLDASGRLVDYDFRKSVIRSRVKGVYGEVNRLLAGEEPPELLEKYREVLQVLPLMRELKDLLRKNRRERGAPEIESTESKLILDENGRILDVKPRERGESELIIEEFMLLANEAAAKLARRLELPFVYRIHEHPDPERIASLRETLQSLGLSASMLKDRVPAAVLAELLEQAKGMSTAPVINQLVLRAMAKAKYSENPVGHYGLALEDYTHFTSPIRRYPDLAIHRILSALVRGEPARALQKQFGKFAVRAASQSSAAELTAMQVERDCEDCYKAEYMKGRVGECFDGMISSVTSFGMYVELPNTVEGLVRMDDLPSGEYFFDGAVQLTDVHTGRRFRMGDRVRVRCTGADVNAGNVDFVLEETAEQTL